MSNMPQMPSIEPSKPQAAGSAESVQDSVLSPSFAGGASEGAPLVEETPKIAEPIKNSSNSIKVADQPRRGIEVVAMDKGFYNQIRRKMGDKFVIRSEEEFGEWFKCVDPNLEKKRIDFMKAKKVRS